jgi:nitrate reductase (NAD(P)H)
VITHPSHEEWICDPNIQDKYNIRGYAYSGGGRRISRVEVSLDGGKNWLPARLHFVENSVRHGFKFWAWCHWSVEVPLWRIVSSKEIVCRAFDMSGNTQPEHHNWNVLGMFNNCWYRVKVTTESTTIASPSIGKSPLYPLNHHSHHSLYLFTFVYTSNSQQSQSVA